MAKTTNNHITEHSLISPFTMEELMKGIKILKNYQAADLDDILCEQIKHMGPKATVWLKEMMDYILVSKKFPKLWCKSKVIAILKLCHTYMLLERMLLKRLNPITEHTIIKEQAGFRAGKLLTSQLLNLTQYIEDGYEKSHTTGAVFVDLSAAYDTVNHRVLLTKLYGMTEDAEFTKLIGSMMRNRRFYVELNGKKCRWRNQKNSLPQGSVLPPVLFNVYTNDQPVHNEKRIFIYADDLCIAAQRSTFEQTETILTEALRNLGEYYERNLLRAKHKHVLSTSRTEKQAGS